MRSIVFFVLAVSCTRAFDATLNEEWKSWKSTNNKYYSFAEEKLRYDVYSINDPNGEFQPYYMGE